MIPLQRRRRSHVHRLTNAASDALFTQRLWYAMPNDVDSFVNMLVTPPDLEPNLPWEAHGTGPDRYACYDRHGRSAELLKGGIVSLPGPGSLRYLDTDNELAVLKEIQKAWVGGYVSGQLFGQVQAELLLNEFLENPDKSVLERFAKLDHRNQAVDREALGWLAYNARRLLATLDPAGFDPELDYTQP